MDPQVPKHPPLTATLPALMFCLYAPIFWIALCDRAIIYIKNWPLFVLTLPGEWFAQSCGDRAEDYYFVAAIATATLLGIGVFASRKNWFIFAVACCILSIWSMYTAAWLWNDLGRMI